MSESNQHVISGLLTKRQELLDETAMLRERIAAVGNDIEALDRVLDSFGYTGDLEGRTARQARIILFYRGELREFLAAQLAKATAPMSTRELAEALCQTEGRDYRDRRMLNDVTKRLSKALRQMRHMGLVTSSADTKGTFKWWGGVSGGYSRELAPQTRACRVAGMLQT